MRRVLLFLFLFAPSVLQAEENIPRLPRDVFDVIPPSDRVQGERGSFHIYQAACRIGPTAWARRRVVDIAVQEWAFFGFQTIDATKAETHLLPQGLVPDSVNPRLGAPRIARDYVRLGKADSESAADATIAGYWSAAPGGASPVNQQNRAWNAPGGDAVKWLQPWSAAFVSWVMCEAGLGDIKQFARDISHRVYIDQAIHARDGTAPDAAFVAYDSGEAAINPGDVLCNARGDRGYRNLADRRAEEGHFAPTHCDIVVKVDEGVGRVFVIGGNVQESVSLTILPAIKDGAFMRPLDDSIVDGARTVFAHLKLRADAIEPNALDNSETLRAVQKQR